RVIRCALRSESTRRNRAESRSTPRFRPGYGANCGAWAIRWTSLRKPPDRSRPFTSTRSTARFGAARAIMGRIMGLRGEAVLRVVCLSLLLVLLLLLDELHVRLEAGVGVRVRVGVREGVKDSPCSEPHPSAAHSRVRDVARLGLGSCDHENAFDQHPKANHRND